MFAQRFKRHVVGRVWRVGVGVGVVGVGVGVGALVAAAAEVVLAAAAVAAAEELATVAVGIVPTPYTDAWVLVKEFNLNYHNRDLQSIIGFPLTRTQ